MVEFLSTKKYFAALHNALLLYVLQWCYTVSYAALRFKCLKQKMWENSALVVRQIEKIGQVSANTLAAAGITSFDKLLETDPRRIEMVSQCMQTLPLSVT